MLSSLLSSWTVRLRMPHIIQTHERFQPGRRKACRTSATPAAGPCRSGLHTGRLWDRCLPEVRPKYSRWSREEWWLPWFRRSATRRSRIFAILICRNGPARERLFYQEERGTSSAIIRRGSRIEALQVWQVLHLPTIRPGVMKRNVALRGPLQGRDASK